MVTAAVMMMTNLYGDGCGTKKESQYDTADVGHDDSK